MSSATTDSKREPFNWTTSDGWKMAGSVWLPAFQPEQVSQYDRPVIVVHGMGEHSGKYGRLATRLNRWGHPVYAMDLRGHGQSPGKRGDAPGFLQLVKDLETFIAAVGDLHCQLPIVVAHSMGGLIATLNAIENPKGMAGLFLISPYYQAAFEPKKWRLILGHIFYHLYPALTLDVGLRLEHLAEDESIRQAIVQDPLSHQKLSARWAIEALRLGKLTPVGRTPLLVPTTIVHGSGDQVTSARASRFFANHQNQLAVETNRSLPVEFHCFDSDYHQIHNDSATRDDVLELFRALKDRLRSDS